MDPGKNLAKKIKYNPLETEEEKIYMRKINKMDVLRLVLVLALVAGIGLAFGSVGRFIPTHKIVQPVYCGSCHPEQVAELSATTHLGKFSEEVLSFTKKANSNGTAVPPTSSAYPNGRIISGACVMCHNYWENMKWYGVNNFKLAAYDGDIPDIGTLTPATDIYGNAVSPYGLGSTKQYAMNITSNATSGLTSEPWKAGLDVYQYSDPAGKHTRLDYVWSALSAVSPGPIGFVNYNAVSGKVSSCGGGTVEHGMCHIAASSVALAYTDQKYEISDYTTSGVNGINSSGPDNGNYGGDITTAFGTLQSGKFAGRSGKGIFFTHEMAFTTAQYAAKPVKICGACHVTKLPPMRWGGEPWAVIDINTASSNGIGDIMANVTANDDPFGFRPTYNGLTGFAGEDMIKEEATYEAGGRVPGTTNLPVAFRTPDWAHANVPCIRCHAHAGINGDTVSNNAEN